MLMSFPVSEMAFELQVDYHSSREEFLDKATKAHMDSLAFWKNGMCSLNKLLDQLTFQRDDLMSKFSQVTTEKAKLKQEYEEKIQCQMSEIAKLQNIVALLNDKLNERNRDQAHEFLKSEKEEIKLKGNEDMVDGRNQESEINLCNHQEKAVTTDLDSHNVIVLLDEDPQESQGKESNFTIKQEIDLSETGLDICAEKKNLQESRTETSTTSTTQRESGNVDFVFSSMPGIFEQGSCNVNSCSTAINYDSKDEGIDTELNLQDLNHSTIKDFQNKKESQMTWRSLPNTLPQNTPPKDKPKHEIDNEVQESITESDIFKCHICSESFQTFSEMEKHQGIHTSVGTDDEIVLDFTSKGSNQNKRNFGRNLKCMICQIVLPSESAYERHLKVHAESHHATSNSTSKFPVVNLDGSLAPSQYDCSTCSKSFASESEWSRHHLSHMKQQLQSFPPTSTMMTSSGYDANRKKVHRCGTCMALFCSLEELQKHLPCHRNVNLDSNSSMEEKPCAGSYSNSCAICSLRFTSGNELKRHMLVHNVAAAVRFSINMNKSPLKCPICPRHFSTETDMKRHVAVHSADVTYSCDQCSEIFICNYDLKRHYRAHTDMKNRRFKCSFCEKRFHYLKDKNRHEHVHTGYKPFQCDMCQKRFSRKDSLQTHLRTHSGEKPHHCEYCGKFFAQRSGLNSHVRSTHANEFAYKCEHCPKRFKFQQNYRAHLQSHTST